MVSPCCIKGYRWLEPRILRVHGRDVLARALATGKGVLLLAPHIGNWEVLGLYLARQAAVTSLYQPPDMATLDKVIRSSREKSGATLVPTNRRGVAALVRALKAGNVSAILPDQVPDKRAGGAFAPFFGHPALTMTLVTNLRRSAGCQVVAGLARRVPGGFEIHFLEAADGIDSDDEARALAALNATVEACVAICPEQYQWEYKRFRKQPDGSNPYKT